MPKNPAGIGPRNRGLKQGLCSDGKKPRKPGGRRGLVAKGAVEACGLSVCQWRQPGHLQARGQRPMPAQPGQMRRQAEEELGALAQLRAHLHGFHALAFPALGPLPFPVAWRPPWATTPRGVRRAWEAALRQVRPLVLWCPLRGRQGLCPGVRGHMRSGPRPKAQRLPGRPNETS